METRSLLSNLITTCENKPYKYVPSDSYSIPDCTAFESDVIDFFIGLDMISEYVFLFYVNFIFIGQPYLYFLRMFLPEIKTKNMKEPFNVVDCILSGTNYKPCCRNNYFLYYFPFLSEKQPSFSCYWR